MLVRGINLGTNPGINPRINVTPTPKPGISNPWEMNSWAQAGVRDTQDEIMSGILGTSTNPINPVILRHRLFQFMALMGQAYKREDETTQKAELNKRANGNLDDLAKSA